MSNSEYNKFIIDSINILTKQAVNNTVIPDLLKKYYITDSDVNTIVITINDIVAAVNEINNYLYTPFHNNLDLSSTSTIQTDVLYDGYKIYNYVPTPSITLTQNTLDKKALDLDLSLLMLRYQIHISGQPLGYSQVVELGLVFPFISNISVLSKPFSNLSTYNLVDCDSLRSQIDMLNNSIKQDIDEKFLELSAGFMGYPWVSGISFNNGTIYKPLDHKDHIINVPHNFCQKIIINNQDYTADKDGTIDIANITVGTGGGSSTACGCESQLNKINGDIEYLSGEIKDISENNSSAGGGGNVIQQQINVNVPLHYGAICWFELDDAPSDEWVICDGNAHTVRLDGETYTVTPPNLIGKYPLGATTQIGNAVEAGLPNISGIFSGVGQRYDGAPNITEGAFSVYNTDDEPPDGVRIGNNSEKDDIFSFDASKGTTDSAGNYMSQADSPYGKSDTVTPPSVKLLPCMYVRKSLPNTATKGASIVIDYQQKGNSWYRKWSDGWIEQGGSISLIYDNDNHKATIELVTDFANSNYTAMITDSGTDTAGPNIHKIISKRTNGFDVYSWYLNMPIIPDDDTNKGDGTWSKGTSQDDINWVAYGYGR